MQIILINEKVTYFVGHDSVENFILTEIDHTKKDFINKVKARVINQCLTPAEQIYDSELFELVKSTSLTMKDTEVNIKVRYRKLLISKIKKRKYFYDALFINTAGILSLCQMCIMFSDALMSLSKIVFK